MAAILYSFKDLIRLFAIRAKYPGAKIRYGARVSLDTFLGKGVHVLQGTVLGSCAVSRHTYIGQDCLFERTEIGPFCSIAHRVVCGVASHPLEFASTYPGLYSNNAYGATWFGANIPFMDKKSVSIGADVWLGVSSIILGGVKLGHGCVVGAGAVVTKDVPPYAIVGGVPARIIRYRFNNELVSKMLSSIWWEAPEEVIREAAPYSSDPETFIAKISRIQNIAAPSI